MIKFLKFLFICIFLDQTAAVGAVLGQVAGSAGSSNSNSMLGGMAGNLFNMKGLQSKDKKEVKRARAANLLYDPGGTFSTLSSWGKGDEDEMIEPFPGYFDLGGDLTSLIRNKMGQYGELYPYSLYTSQPGVESAAERTILGKLSSPDSVSAYSSDITGKLYDARKANLNESFEDERKKTQDMYNRLGLASSTPGLQAQQDLNRKQTQQEDEIISQLMYEDIARELEAKKLTQSILSDYTGKALDLGGSQRAAEQAGLSAEYNDFLRAYNEPYNWASLGSSVLGGGEGIYVDNPNQSAQASSAAM